MLYDEAKTNILEGRYPCDPEHWLMLGALSCAVELGTGLDDQALTTAIRCPPLLLYLCVNEVNVKVFSYGFLLKFDPELL